MGRPPMPPDSYGTFWFVELEPGKWEARARYRSIDGDTRQYRATGRSRAASERALRTRLNDARPRTHDAGIGRDSLVSDLVDAWLREVDANTSLAIGTRRVYRLTAQTHIKPRLGQLRVREVGVPALDRFLRKVHDSSGASAAKTARSVLSGMFGLAVRHGALPANPVRDAGRVRSSRKEGARALTVDEARRLRAVVRDDDRACELDLPDLIDWMLYTGCRLGEALACREPVIDLDHLTWEINATVVRAKGEGLIVQTRTKSQAGWRVLALPKQAGETVVRRRDEPRLRVQGGYLFSSPKARALRDPSNTAADLRSVLGRVDEGAFSWVTSHTFRKTVATRLDEAGLSARQIADQLGHARPSLTQDSYMGRNVVNSRAAEILGT